MRTLKLLWLLWFISEKTKDKKVHFYCVSHGNFKTNAHRHTYTHFTHYPTFTQFEVCVDLYSLFTLSVILSLSVSSLTCLKQTQSRKTWWVWDRWKRQIHFLQLVPVETGAQRAGALQPTYKSGCGLLRRWFMGVLAHFLSQFLHNPNKPFTAASPAP